MIRTNIDILSYVIKEHYILRIIYITLWSTDVKLLGEYHIKCVEFIECYDFIECC